MKTHIVRAHSVLGAVIWFLMFRCSSPIQNGPCRFVNAANAAEKVQETVQEKHALLLMQCSQNRMKKPRALMLIRAEVELAFDCISET